MPKSTNGSNHSNMYTNEVEFSISKMKVFVQQYQNISIFQTTTPSKWNRLSKEDDDDYVDDVST